jgi:hypothetical protein
MPSDRLGLSWWRMTDRVYTILYVVSGLSNSELDDSSIESNAVVSFHHSNRTQMAITDCIQNRPSI